MRNIALKKKESRMSLSRKILVAACLLAAVSAPASAETLIEKRLKVFENQVGGFFAQDPATHRASALRDARDLKLALIDRKRGEILVLQAELAAIEAELAYLEPAPAPRAAMEPPVAFTMPEPIRTCVLGEDGCR
jgi:hypothetical protein